MALTILEGSTFCICDERGDMGGRTTGFFARDTRFLSKFELRVNGKRPVLLSSKTVEYYSAAFFLRNPSSNELPQDTLLIVLDRFVGETMQDQLTVMNEASEATKFTLAIEFGSDFADILYVKSQDDAFGDPSGAARHPAAVVPTYDATNNQFLFEDPAPPKPITQVILDRPGEVGDGSVTYRIDLEPREEWTLRIDVVPSENGEVAVPSAVDRRFGDEKRLIQESLRAWRLNVPKLRTGWDDLAHSFETSVADLASLRIRGRNRAADDMPAAGMPWFMTVFGRDTIITCLQTLLFGPDLARNALRRLAELQAREDDPDIDAEPGKIVHEVRQGKAAEVWYERYYGTVDATPLYLILLSEVWRWTGDARLVRQLREPALLALEWIDKYGDRDGDGFVEYERRASPGIRNQSWKDSDESQMFADGTIAEPPIAAVEVQGYVYDAKLRVAELAREVWRDRPLAERLETEARALYEAFNEAFWSEERGHYVLALDREKKQVDALGSNVGHLLWSGIVRPERVDAVVDALMAPGLWSGWGVRTMSSAEPGYNPLSYHNGTVWPHDNSLIAWGLARSGRWNEARRIIRRMLEAAGTFEYRLPEVFAGLSRDDTPFPIAYPTAARPQAWAAGTPVLLLQLLLGLQPDTSHQTLECVAPEVPSWARPLSLSSVRAFDHTWDVRVDAGDGEIEIARA